MTRFRLIPISMMLASLSLAGCTAPQAGPATPQPTGRPQRIVSLNLCSDQLVLALADRDQIAGLTRNAIDPEMSAEVALTPGLHIMGTSAEEILDIRPDLVVGMPARRSAAMSVLRGRDFNTIDLPFAETYADIVASIRQVAAAVGHPERGEAMIRDMDRDLAAIPRNGNNRVAAFYQRRGFMTGTGTLVDDLMHRLGLVNLAARLGKPPLAQVSLEEMVEAKPDLLILESATDRVQDQGTEMLHHPAIANIPRVSIPQAWTVCGTRAYVRAARALAGQP